MTTDVQLRDRFKEDLPGFICEATAPYHLSRLIFQVLRGSDELNALPPEDRLARIERLAAKLSAAPDEARP
ncbi:MAG: hypothetical protein AAFN79_11935 [Pseudomonadota bacterium]